MTKNWKLNALAATNGSRFGAIIACALGEEIDAPCFNGKASITSDGYVMCNFTDRDGIGRMGAFVGDASDLARNARGLARHLDLTVEERKEFFDTIKDWIATDYSRKGLGL